MADISATHNSEKLANPITDSSGDPVTLDDNPAHVAGFLYEVSRYFQREGLHSALIRYGAVVLKNGTTAVSQLNQIPFVLQSITYASGAKPVTYTIESPFPMEVDDAIATYTGLDPSHNFDPFTVKTVPSGFIHQPLIVQQEDAKLGGMLLRAIEDETFREEMQDKSGGNGRVLLQLLADHGKTAKPRDITLVTTKYNTVASAGVSGPLTRESFNEWIKLLLKARRAVPPKSRSSDEQICEIIDQVFFGDQAGDLGNLYELHLSQHRPGGNLVKHLKMARDLLSGRERSNQILEAKSKMSLLSGVVVPEPSVIEALARGDGAAAVALFSGPSKDPVKTKRTFDPGSIPRDAQGRVSEWVPGMSNCPCGRPKCIIWKCQRDFPLWWDSRKYIGPSLKGKSKGQARRMYAEAAAQKTCFSGSVEINLPNNSPIADDDFAAIAEQLASADFGGDAHFSGIAVERPSLSCSCCPSQVLDRNSESCDDGSVPGLPSFVCHGSEPGFESGEDTVDEDLPAVNIVRDEETPAANIIRDQETRCDPDLVPGAPEPSCEESARVRARMAKSSLVLADSAVAAGGDGGRRRASRAGPHLRQYLRWAASTHCGAARSP